MQNLSDYKKLIENVDKIFKIQEQNPYENIIINEKYNEYFIKMNKTSLKKNYFEPFETFIFGKSIDEYFNGMKMSNFCAKTFQHGEILFSCSECASDETCALCINCFKNSQHQNHRYKYYETSGSGGYCDCGDSEAWSRFPTCDIHLNNKTLNIDVDVKIRIKIVVGIIISYILYINYRLDNYLSKNNFSDNFRDSFNRNRDNLRDNLRDKSFVNDNKYAIVFFNDELHTYYEVEENLVFSTKCSDHKAMNLAEYINLHVFNNFIFINFRVLVVFILIL